MGVGLIDPSLGGGAAIELVIHTRLDPSKSSSSNVSSVEKRFKDGKLPEKERDFFFFFFFCLTGLGIPTLSKSTYTQHIKWPLIKGNPLECTSTSIGKFPLAHITRSPPTIVTYGCAGTYFKGK